MINAAVGVTPAQATTGNNSASQSATNTFQINGTKATTSDQQINGAANLVSYLNQVAAIPQVDAVEEFRVVTSAYAPENGRTSGAVVQFSLRSGTSQYRGSAFEFFRDDRFDENSFDAERAGIPKADLERNQFGFTAGGPVAVAALEPDVLLRRLRRAAPAAGGLVHRHHADAAGADGRLLADARRERQPDRDLRPANDPARPGGAGRHRPLYSRSISRQPDPDRVARPGGAEHPRPVPAAQPAGAGTERDQQLLLFSRQRARHRPVRHAARPRHQRRAPADVPLRSVPESHRRSRLVREPVLAEQQPQHDSRHLDDAAAYVGGIGQRPVAAPFLVWLEPDQSDLAELRIRSDDARHRGDRRGRRRRFGYFRSSTRPGSRASATSTAGTSARRTRSGSTSAPSRCFAAVT